MITTRKLERQRRKYKITPPRKGDVFTIPLDDGRVHLGQVIAFERFDLLFYTVVFDLVTTPERAPGLVDRALASRPILAGQTMDALFRPGGWKVVGNRPSEAARFLPAYKRDTPQGIFVKDFLATRQRPATPEEAERLPARALRLAHGLPDGAQLLPRPGRPPRLLRHHGPRQYHHRPRGLRRLRY